MLRALWFSRPWPQCGFTLAGLGRGENVRGLHRERLQAYADGIGDSTRHCGRWWCDIGLADAAHPDGVARVRDLDYDCFDHWQIKAGRDPVVEIARIFELPGLVIVVFFV